MTDPAPSTARVPSSVKIRHTITRACEHCGSPRSTDSPCAGCGDTCPATVVDLGVVTAAYRNPVKRAWWTLLGQPLADRRIRRANRAAARNR